MMAPLSYWLQENVNALTVSEAIRLLNERGWSLRVEEARDRWWVTWRDCPKWDYATEEMAATRVAMKSDDYAVRYFHVLNLVIEGDQFLFTSESSDEINGFIFGLLAHEAVKAP